jgi:ABC-type transport system involved in multi-copper enzyme maturation permease subunit
MITDRTYERELSGRELDEELISKMQEAYGYVPEVPLYSATEEYQTYARPYSAIYGLVRSVSRLILNTDDTELDALELEGSQYYVLREEAILNRLKEENLTIPEVKKHQEMNEQVKTPFVFRYTDGYNSILSRMYTIGMILTMALAICLSPVFANEFSDKTDQLILTSKWGKNKAILAKLLTGMSFGFIMTVIVLLVQIIPTLSIYGFDGWNAQIQLLNVMITYPFTVLEGVLIVCGMAVLSSLLITSLSLFLSARLKSASAVIVAISTYSIIIMFLNIPMQYRFLYQLVKAMPINILNKNGAFSDYFILVFGKCIPAYQAVPVIYGLVSVCLLVLGYRAFKNHQIS